VLEPKFENKPSMIVLTSCGSGRKGAAADVDGVEASAPGLLREISETGFQHAG